VRSFEAGENTRLPSGENLQSPTPTQRQSAHVLQSQ
jgi:hypothetical protein